MDLSKLTGHIWLDGEMVPWQEARVHVLTHTFHYGLGVFEGVRAYKTPDGTSIFRLKEHTDRLFRSAHILRMDMPYDKKTLSAAQCEVVVWRVESGEGGGVEVGDLRRELGLGEEPERPGEGEGWG